MAEFEGNLLAENAFEHMAEFNKIFGYVNQFRFQRLFA